jgi:hypothetical protein
MYKNNVQNLIKKYFISKRMLTIICAISECNLFADGVSCLDVDGC